MRYLASAIACWFFIGIVSVIGFRALGERLLSQSAAPAAAALRELPSVARITLTFLFVDGWSYVRHRLEHGGGERRLLWRLIHRWHHTPAHVSLWTGMVVHPLEAVLILAPPMTVLGGLGIQTWEGLMAFSVFMIVAMPQHMNSGWSIGPLGAIIHGPEAHTRHHSQNCAERNRNFADCLALWDRLGGTFTPALPTVFVGPFGAQADAAPLEGGSADAR